MPLELPPLRERRDDIPELTHHLFRRLKERHDLPALRLAPSVVGAFSAHRWPGNVRELENVIERMVVLSAGDEITLDDLPEPVRAAAPHRDSLLLELPDHGISLEAVERELLLRALEESRWNQSQAARYLDISRRTLIYRMEKHGLRRD